MSRPYVDLLLVVPLEEELVEVFKVFKPLADQSVKSDFRFFVDSRAQGISMLVVQQEDMGKTFANRATTSALEVFDAGIVVCIGIAGGITNDLRLGDVCYTGTIIDVHDKTSAIEEAKGKFALEFSPTQYRTPRDITQAINFIRTHPDLSPLYEQWRKERQAYAPTLGIDTISAKDGIAHPPRGPKTKNGSIVCGVVSKSPSYNKRLKAIDRKCLAIETESGGVFEAAESVRVPGLTIRGISDYADLSKGALEDRTDGKIRELAASNAVTFLKLQLSNKLFLAQLHDRKSQSGQNNSAFSAPIVPLDDIAILIQDIDQEIDAKLRELCPEYRLQPRGYVLPVPRIRKTKKTAGLGDLSDDDPVAISDALGDTSRMVVSVPTNYPDNSLAWVIANDLQMKDVHDKKFLPLIVDGASIKPPKGTIDSLLANRKINNYDLSGAQPILIVDNTPIASKTKMNFIVEQLKLYPEYKSIFIVRSDINLANRADAAVQLAAEPFELCAYSFMEMAHFIERNFDMSSSESEVIALKLNNTFKQFGLAAHPTYFAGIPKESLSALLQANRRSELIDLGIAHISK